MRTILTLIGFLANIIDIFLLMNVLEYFCSRSFKNRTVYFGIVLILSIADTVIRTYVGTYIISITLVFLMLFICFYVFYKPWSGILVSLLVWFIITVGLEWLTLNILTVLFDKNFIELSTETLVLILTIFISKGLSFSVIYFLFKRTSANGIVKAFSLYQYIFFVMTFLVLCNSAVLFNNLAEGNGSLSNSTAIYYFSCIILLFLSVLYLFDRLVRIVKENEEARIVKEHERAQQLFAEEIHTMLEHLKGLNHDYRHHLELLMSMAELHNNPKAYDYVQQLLTDYSKTSLGFIDNCHVISLLLMQAAKTAKMKDIEFECNVPAILNTEIRETDLNIILSNLLENAFEATMKNNTDRKISLNLYTKKDCLFIKIHNTYSDNLKLWRGQYMTTKKNKSFHGYGLRNVRRIVETYDGELWLEPTDGLFKTTVALSL